MKKTTGMRKGSLFLAFMLSMAITTGPSAQVPEEVLTDSPYEAEASWDLVTDFSEWSEDIVTDDLETHDDLIIDDPEVPLAGPETGDDGTFASSSSAESSSSEEGQEGSSSASLFRRIAIFAVLAAIILFLIWLLVFVFGRRRRDK